MKKVLEDLYFGEIQPNISSCNDNIKNDLRIIDENEEILIKLLEGKEKKLFLDFANAWSKINGSNACQNFIKGFELGAKIIIECLMEP